MFKDLRDILSVRRPRVCCGLFHSLCQVVFRGLRLIRNLTVHDILSVDAILQHSLAPDLMLQLGLSRMALERKDLL